MKSVKYESVSVRRSRAAAEIETLLVIPILILIIFMLGAMLILGPARLLNIFQSNEVAYRDATVAVNPQFAGTPPINDSMSEAFPSESLPKRVHVSDIQTPVPIRVGSLSQSPLLRIEWPSITLKDKATFVSPPWAYSNFPATADGAVVQQWMQGYADESLVSLEDPLDLSPAWPP